MIDVLSVEKTNLLEKIRFLESEHNSLLEKNNALTQDIKNNKPSSSVNEIFYLGTKVFNEFLINAKPMVIKEVWGALTKMKLPLVGKLCFPKVRMIQLTK